MIVHDCADYIIWKTTEDQKALNLLKLQKLCYYVQAWNLAIKGEPMFPGNFEAWVHGPVNRDLYNRFRESHQLYGAVTIDDVRPGFSPAWLGEIERQFIDSVLDEYAGYSGSQLEELTHREDPWVKARIGYGPYDRCEKAIDDKLMASFYGARLGH